jgi:hypothetical protein
MDRAMVIRAIDTTAATTATVTGIETAAGIVETGTMIAMSTESVATGVKL